MVNFRFLIPAGLAALTCVYGQAVKVREGVPLTAHFEWSSIDSLPGKAVTDAPYSARVVTTSTQTLADGNRITHTTEVNLARDSQGRTRREQKLGSVGPWATNENGSMVTIDDPVAGTMVVLTPDGKSAMKTVKTIKHAASGSSAHVTGVAGGSGGAVFEHRVEGPVVMAGGAEKAGTMVFIRGGAGAASAGSPVHLVMKHDEGKTEDLGTQVIEGVPAQGKRTRMTIPAGEIGNERAMEIVSESWFSNELQLVVMSKRSDPRTGDTEFRMTNITRVEPSPSLFEIPANVKVINTNKQ